MEKIITNDKKLSFGTKFGYALGSFGDSVPYNLFSLYFLFYLTDVVGMQPAIAGTISSVAVLWNAIANPIVGQLSDNSTSRYGRRRPFMLAGIPMQIVAILLLFTPNGFTGTVQVVYYFLVAMLFWTAYVTYLIPFGALGAEITDDYNERTSLRAYNGFIGSIIIMIVSSGPMMVQSVVIPRGATVQEAWTMTGVIFVCLIAVFCMISWNSLRGKEKIIVKTEKEDVKKENIFVSIKEIFKIKPYRMLVAAIAIYVTGATLEQTCLVYVLSYAAGMTPAQQSMYWIVGGCVTLAAVPVVTKVSAKIGKKKTLVCACIMIVAVFLIFGLLIGVSSSTHMYVMTIIVNFPIAAFWTLYVSMTYDLSELDEWINNKRREGILLSVVLFVQKVGAAIAIQLAGILLGMVGYQNGMMQTPETIDGIVKISFVCPAILIAVAAFLFIKSPLTREKFAALQNALVARRSGKESSNEGFEDLL